MKKIYLTLSIGLGLFIITLIPVFSQFEQKFTLNFAIGHFRPLGPEEYSNAITYTPSRLYAVDGEGETEFTKVYPYIMSNFDPGVLFSAGIQYNINRRFSIAGNIMFFKNWNWSYQYYYYDFDLGIIYDEPYEQYVIPESDPDYGWEWDANHDDDVDDIIEKGENEYSLYNLGLGIAPKFYFVPQGKFRPYIFAEGSFNYTSIDYVNNEDPAWERVVNNYADEIGYEEEITLDYDPLDNMLDKSIGIGAYPGLGFDIQANDNIGIFLQGGYSIIFLDQAEMKDNGLEPENFHTIRMEAGIKISFLKSKNL